MMSSPLLQRFQKEGWFPDIQRNFSADPIGFLTRLAKEFGEVAKFRLGPFQNVYHVLNPDLGNGFKNYSQKDEKDFPYAIMGTD